MCGICGLVGAGVGPSGDDATVLARMSNAMVHRGPDDHGEFSSAGVAFGARRLSIVDVEGGHQPFSDDSGTVTAVQNGEIYNHVELRRELEKLGHTFRSRCDTEVIPHLYRRYGPDFAEKLRGMFAIAVWDEREQRAILIRDRLGIKPLYYARVGDRLFFASELRSIIGTQQIPLDLDYEGISAYLELGYFPGALTPLAAVSKLPAGHRLIVHPSHEQVERWWEYPIPNPGPTRLGLRHYAEALLAELEESVRLRLMSDRPFGAMLSGGLDSSLIVALMAPQLSDPVKTFSVGFKEDQESNELAVAQKVADQFGCEHRQVELSMVSDTLDLPRLAWDLDEPTADLSALGFHALSAVAAEDVTMALSGQGADELLGGYRKHRVAAAMDRRPYLARGARLLPERVLARAPGPWGRLLTAFAAEDPASRLLAMSGIPLADRDEGRGGVPGLPQDAARRAIETLAGRLPRAGSALAGTLFLDAQLALVDDMLLYFDRMSMAHSLEVRVPFLDHKLVEFCATIPDEFKVHGAVTKRVLKEAAAGILPPEIIHRKKIGFFRQATTAWFEAQAESALEDVLLDPGARYQSFLSRSAVERSLIRGRRSGDEDTSRQLVTLLMLELWLARLTA